MTSIIRDLMDVDHDITLQYRNSKLPKFIKKIIAKGKRKKLYKSIDFIDNVDEVPVELLDEYSRVVYDTYPPFGRYRNCSKIVDNNDGKIITFIVRIDEKRLGIMLINLSESLHENSERIAIIRYTFMVDGKTKFSYGENLKYTEFLARDNDVVNDITATISSEQQKRIIKNICIDALHDDIVYFLKDLVERSERVYKI